MGKINFLVSDVKAMPRPPEYLDELREIALESNDVRITIDAEDGRYIRLREKYRNYVPASGDLTNIAVASRITAPDLKKDLSLPWGPLLWKELHEVCLAGTLNLEWLVKFGRRIPCGDCRQHWTILLKLFPPVFDASTFEWSVVIHNAVNRILDKPIITLKEAKSIYQPASPASD